jgi:hypothetical protein
MVNCLADSSARSVRIYGLKQIQQGAFMSIPADAVERLIGRHCLDQVHLSSTPCYLASLASYLRIISQPIEDVALAVTSVDSDL